MPSGDKILYKLQYGIGKNIGLRPIDQPHIKGRYLSEMLLGSYKPVLIFTKSILCFPESHRIQLILQKHEAACVHIILEKEGAGPDLSIGHMGTSPGHHH